MELESTSGDIQAAIDAGKLIAKQDPVDIKGTLHILVPKDMELKDLSALNDEPARIERSATLLTSDSFIEYFNLFADSNSIIYCDASRAKFKAVLDHTSKDQPSWEGHTATYACPFTDEWEKWRDSNGRKMSQQDFAEFIEQHTPEVISPTGAEMLEIASSLQANNKVDFESGIRLDNGETQLLFKETLESSAGKNGSLSIPTSIKIGIRVFQGGDPYEIEAKFRYRIGDDHKIKMWYDLVRPLAIYEDAVKGIIKQITEGVKKTEGIVLQGEA